MSRILFPLAYRAAAVAALLALLPGPAQACDLQLTGDPSAAWQRAFRELSASQQEGDCARLGVDVQGSAARLTYVTRDGRRAERALGSPAELAPALAALRVLDPDTEPVAPPARAATPAAQQRSVAGRSRVRGASPMLTALTGLRAGSEALLSPVVHVSLLAQLQEHWELGVFGSWETGYFSGQGKSEFARYGEGLLGGGFAHRRRLKGFTLLGGARLAYARLYSYDNEPPFQRPSYLAFPGGALRVVIPINTGRAAVFAGISFPAGNARTRLRAELGADFVLRQRTIAVVPNWALFVLLGMELGWP